MKDGSVDLGLVDMTFQNDKQLMEQIETLLWQKMDNVDN